MDAHINNRDKCVIIEGYFATDLANKYWIDLMLEEDFLVTNWFNFDNLLPNETGVRHIFC